jgi:S-adenosylmethionine synthetase
MEKTAEFVSPAHPDKICDRIADAILDAYHAEDPDSRVAVEVMGGHGRVAINGEVTSTARPDIVRIVEDLVGQGFTITESIVAQSPEIARGVDAGGAGDQGIMKGYATSETESHMPMEYELARTLAMELFTIYPYDGKTQVTVRDGKPLTVVASFQNAPTKELLAHIRRLVPAEHYFANPAGEWQQGGFDADTGLSGRKLIVDNYGPEIAIGGGSFSGKDHTKVDRSGAYMARRVAVDYLAKYGAKEVHTKLAYAIGVAEPVMAVAVVDGKEMPIEGYDLTPAGIRKFLALDTVEFVKTAEWGHFGRGFSWDGSR